jgi:L-glyceraldehyde 3-phosphate reductase
LWHNFGHADDGHLGRKILRKAFDLGCTHFDCANNYGPPYGSAEENFGLIFKKDFLPFRDELVLSTKAGYDMWPGPYGRGGSKKYIVRSCEASLERMGVDHVDIFYHHCPDAETPLEETADALEHLVRSGKTLYVGLSNYVDENLLQSMIEALSSRGIPLLVNQLRYSMLDRRAEASFACAKKDGFGVIAFSPLEQGLLTGKYNSKVPAQSRLNNERSYLKQIDPTALETVRRLTSHAETFGLSMTELALKWLLKRDEVSSILVGVSSIEQLEANVKAVQGSALEPSLIELVNQVLS